MTNLGKKVLVYAPEGVVANALENVIALVYDAGKIVFSSDLKEIRSGKYGLVIDASTLNNASNQETVVNEVKRLDRAEAPKIVRVYNAPTVIADIGKLAARFYGG